MDEEEPIKKECYSRTQILWIAGVYIFFIVFWILLVWYFDLYKKITSIVLVIPIIVFVLALCNINCMTEESTKELFQTSFVTIGIIFSVPLLTLVSRESNLDVQHITQIIIIAIVMILLSYLHICTYPGYEVIWKHCCNCFETMAIVLFIYCLITYFLCIGK